ncbi:hypothetical protein LB504_002955 [Fusarium proliferatum]|nr:hypothetical protein LB504_002955 [Fusarium proliferatum]
MAEFYEMSSYAANFIPSVYGYFLAFDSMGFAGVVAISIGSGSIAVRRAYSYLNFPARRNLGARDSPKTQCLTPSGY